MFCGVTCQCGKAGNPFEERDDDETGDKLNAVPCAHADRQYGIMPLEPAHIERVYQRLATTGETDWLAEREACDLFIDSPLSAVGIAEQARDALSGTSIDTVCTSVKGRRKKLLISDMDSTVINQECIDELGDAIGAGSQIKEITAAVINGDISFSDALRKRLALMKGMERRLLKIVYEERITLKAGARVLVQTMRHHGAFCILVSGGFSFFTRRIAERIGFHDHQGNELAFEDGKLTGEALEPILGRSAKLDTLRSLCDEKGLEPSDVLALGDCLLLKEEQDPALKQDYKDAFELD